MKNIIALLFVLSLVVSACNKQDSTQQNSSPGQTTTQSGETKSGADSTIIRDANVDVASIDANKDGKVFQCPMHAEVISDKQQSCPLCKMDLDEVTVAEASKNLK